MGEWIVAENARAIRIAATGGGLRCDAPVRLARRRKISRYISSAKRDAKRWRVAKQISAARCMAIRENGDSGGGASGEEGGGDACRFFAARVSAAAARGLRRGGGGTA